MKRQLFLLLVFATALSAVAQTDNTDIVSHITESGVNTVVQPEALAKLLKKTASVKVTEAQTSEAEEAGATRDYNAGYRVQVFSDNRPAAKNEARAKGSHIAERFPNYRTYVKYNSPYWRLRVGDFRTRREAEDAAEAIKQAFPAYSKEVRVVADRITITAN